MIAAIAMLVLIGLPFALDVFLSARRYSSPQMSADKKYNDMLSLVALRH